MLVSKMLFRCSLVASLTALSTAAAGASAGAESLRAMRWQRLPIGEVLPRGWLARQAGLQAAALTSHLPLFWTRIANASWVGGTFPDSEGTPYWLNGATPLAFQMKDEKLIGEVHKYLTTILDRQDEDGWLGPDVPKSNFWPRFPLVLALVQYHEATTNETDRQRILQATIRFLASVKRRLDAGAKLVDWAAARAHDLIWAIHYLVDVLAAGGGDGRRGLALGAPELLELARQLRDGGYQWHEDWFNSSAFPKEAVTKNFTMYTHGVNNAQAVKFGAVWSRQSDDPGASAAQSWGAWEVLRKFHGQPNGMPAADEHLAGRNPSRGTELCAVVELMWSMNLVAQASTSDHDAAQALDALESMAFNALPGSLSADLWSHPYLQFANSYQAVHSESPHPWAHDGPDSAMYGLEPNFECCTANFHQGYPKFIANLFYTIPAEKTLVSAIWAPSTVQTAAVGGGVEVELKTDYPFGRSAEYIIKNPEAFKLKVRLPAFLRRSEGPSKGFGTVRVWVEGHERILELVDGFLTYDIPAWSLEEPRVAVRLQWDATPEVQRSDVPAVQGASVYLGPLLLALDLSEERRLWKRYAFEAADWDTTTSKEWRYAIVNSSSLSETFGPVLWRLPGEQPYSRGEGCPLAVSTSLAKVTAQQWPSCDGAPGSFGGGAAAERPGNLAREQVSLLPYACTSIRISAFPDKDGEAGMLFL